MPPKLQRVLVAAIVTFGLLPVGVEAIATAAGAEVEAEVAHGGPCQDDEDASPCPERDCGPTCHLCACCHGSLGVVTQVVVEPTPPHYRGWDASAAVDPVLHEGRRRIERPPTA